MTERINVRRIQMPEQEKLDPHFDEKRDVPTEYRKKLMDELDVCMEDSAKPTQFAGLAADLATLFGSEKLLKLLDNKRWSAHKKFSLLASRSRMNKDWKELFRHAAQLQIFDPKYAQRVMLIDDAEWVRMQKVFERGHKRADGSTILDMAADMVILGKRPKLTEVDLNKIQKDTELLQKKSLVFPLFRYAARIKLVDPSRVPAFSELQWEQMTQHLDIGKPIVFARCASSMKILTADEVKITEHGIELTMRKPKINETKKSLPETVGL